MVDGQQPSERRERILENAWFVFVMILGVLSVGIPIAFVVRAFVRAIFE